MVATTSSRSDCLGVKRGRRRPKRSVSKRGPVTDMYSMPQQAVTNGYWKKANFRAQASASSYRDVKNASRRRELPGRRSGSRGTGRCSVVMVSSGVIASILARSRPGAGPVTAPILLGHALREVGLVDDHARPARSLGRIAVRGTAEL